MRNSIPRPTSDSPAEARELGRIRRRPNSINTLMRLQRVGRQVRKQGYAISNGDLTENIVDAAAAIRNSSGIVVGAVSVGARINRIRDGNQALGALVAESAHALSRRLGYPPSS